MSGPNENCAPDDFYGLKDIDRLPEDRDGTSGLQQIYYSQDFMRTTCGWMYQVADTDHRGFLLDLSRRSAAAPDDSCWRNIRS